MPFQAGRRWLRQQVSGKEIIKEVELVEGREHPGQKSWILSFSGIETVDRSNICILSFDIVPYSQIPIYSLLKKSDTNYQ